MARVSTLEPLLWPLMDLPSMDGTRCCVCGATYPLNRHHVPPRSAGQLLDSYGKPREKPTLMLCGSGNTSGCHGLAHHKMLHFKNQDGRWYYLKTEVPTKYYKALEMDGWQPLESNI